ncbi:MAG: signal peptidase II [Nitrososphaerota archaeon]
MTTARKRDLAMVGLGLLVVVLDQLTKHWIVSFFSSKPDGYVVPILGEILSLIYVKNTGVAFSLLEGQMVMFLFIALAIGVVSYLYWRSRETGSLLLKLSFGLVLGGAIGNLIDRFSHTYVVDFIHFQIPAVGFNFAVFNVADSAISVGVVLLAFMIWRMGIEGERPASSRHLARATDPAETPAED